MYNAQVMSETSKFQGATHRIYFKFGIKFRQGEAMENYP
jgi:hypothetical protein